MIDRWAVAAVFVGLAPGLSCAAPGKLEIRVLADGGARPQGSRECAADRATPCSATLLHVLSMIQSREWRRQLAGRFDVVRVEFPAGVYRLAEPIQIRWGRGDTQGIRLELAGPDDASAERNGGPVISGARLVGARMKSAAAELPEGASRHVMQFDVSQWPAFDSPPSRGFGQPIKPVMAELFLGDQVLPVARWPNEGYARLQRPAGIEASERKTFSVEGRTASDWRSEADLQAFAYWYHDWAAQTFPVKVTEGGALTIEGSGSPYGIKTGQRVRIENALSELDAPGEWYLDRERRRLYVWPPRAIDGDQLEISFAAGLLRIEDSRGVRVRDLAFEKARGDAVSVRDSEDVVLERVSIRYIGNRAIVIEGGARCGIRDSLLEHEGEGGVTLSGGNRQMLTASNHFVERSVIRDFSRLSKTYRPGVEMNGVGQQAVGNAISEAPHTAILFTGNDHHIVGNEIFKVVQETGDAGAIYTGRDYTARGTVIENNFLHDIQPDGPGHEVKGVYLDDQASGITIRRNIFARVQQPVFIGGGRDNLVESNVFYRSSPAITLDARGLGWQRAATLDAKRELQTRLDAVPYQQPVYATRYPNLAKIREDEIGAPKYNVARGNVVVKGLPYRVEAAARGGIDLGGLAEQTEDVFAAAPPPGARTKRSDFSLK